MNVRPHRYATRLRWSGETGDAAMSYPAYSRTYTIEADGKPVLGGSADPHFRGDSSRYNPEDLLVAALSACHLLSYLAVCSRAGIVVTAYEDAAEGEMTLIDGKIRFREVTLHPHVTIADASRADEAHELHERAHSECFIANSVNFPVSVTPSLSRGPRHASLPDANVDREAPSATGAPRQARGDTGARGDI
jgi:organic hydroperoxide reductase OsmC/OhrA